MPLPQPTVDYATQDQDKDKSPRYLNVRVDGMEECADEDAYAAALELLHKLSVKCDNRDLSLVQRLDLRRYQTGPRTMLICFTTIQMRRAVLQAKWSMKQIVGLETVYINPDEDIATRKRNHRMRLIVNYCRTKLHVAIIKKDNVVVNDVVYQDLDNIPSSLQPPPGYKYTKLPWNPTGRWADLPDKDLSKGKDNVPTGTPPPPPPMGAWGKPPQSHKASANPRVLQTDTRSGIIFTGEMSTLSSIHPQEIIYENDIYKSSEHLFQHLKCVHNAAPPSVRESIKKAHTGELAFEEGRKIRTNNSWVREELPLMKKVQTLKFTGSNHNRTELLDTFPQDLVFACSEPFWGGGEPYGHECYTRGFYPGRNHLGVILMEIQRLNALRKSVIAPTLISHYT